MLMAGRRAFKGLELIAVRVRQIAEESVAQAAAQAAGAAAGLPAAAAAGGYSTLTPGSSPAYSNGGTVTVHTEERTTPQMSTRYGSLGIHVH